MGVKARFYLDLLERSLWTGVQTFLGAMAVDGIWLQAELTTEAKLKIALGAALVAVAKCVLSTQLPWTRSNTASSLPSDSEPST